MELLNCPFCGSKNIDVEKHRDKYQVVCMICYASGGRHVNKQKAIEMWNNRVNNNKIKYMEGDTG